MTGLAYRRVGDSASWMISCISKTLGPANISFGGPLARAGWKSSLWVHRTKSPGSPRDDRTQQTYATYCSAARLLMGVAGLPYAGRVLAAAARFAASRRRWKRICTS